MSMLVAASSASSTPHQRVEQALESNKRISLALDQFMNLSKGFEDRVIRLEKNQSLMSQTLTSSVAQYPYSAGLSLTIIPSIDAKSVVQVTGCPSGLQWILSGPDPFECKGCVMRQGSDITLTIPSTKEFTTAIPDAKSFFCSLRLDASMVPVERPMDPRSEVKENNKRKKDGKKDGKKEKKDKIKKKKRAKHSSGTDEEDDEEALSKRKALVKKNGLVKTRIDVNED